MKKVVLACTAFCLIIGSCKKKESEPNRTDLLTNGKWLMTSGTINTYFGGLTFTNDMFEFLPSCKKDNLLIFRSDKALITDEGATKCNTTDSQQVYSGTWALTQSDSKLTFGDYGVGTFTIDTLNNSILTISADTAIKDNTGYVTSSLKAHFTFSHQN